MATLNMAASSVLTTVSETAETFTNLVQSVGTGAKMINDFTSNAREQQLIKIKLGKVGFTDRAMREKTIEIAKSQKILDDYIKSNPTQKQLCDDIWKQLKAALA